MMEETTFAGDPPDRALAYRLRNLAVTTVCLRTLIENITIEIPGHEFRIIVYLQMSFGVPIPLLKELAAYLALNDWRTEKAIKAVEDSIESKRSIWSARLQPAQ